MAASHPYPMTTQTTTRPTPVFRETTTTEDHPYPMVPPGFRAHPQGSISTTMIWVIVIVKLSLLMSLTRRRITAVMTHSKTLCSYIIKIHHLGRLILSYTLKLQFRSTNLGFCILILKLILHFRLLVAECKILCLHFKFLTNTIINLTSCLCNQHLITVQT